MFSFHQIVLYFPWYRIHRFLQECQRPLVQFLSFHGTECTADYRILQVSTMGLWLACGVPWSVLPSGAYRLNSYATCCSAGASCCSTGVFLSTSRSIIVLIVLVESTLVGSGFLEQFIVIGLVLVLVVISHRFACYLLVVRNVYTS